jgi:hypothetical protein
MAPRHCPRMSKGRSRVGFVESRRSKRASVVVRWKRERTAERLREHLEGLEQRSVYRPENGNARQRNSGVEESARSNDATSPIRSDRCKYTSFASLVFNVAPDSPTISSTGEKAVARSSPAGWMRSAFCHTSIRSIAAPRFRTSDFRSRALRESTESASSPRKSRSTSSKPEFRSALANSSALACCESPGSRCPTMMFASRTTSAVVIKGVGICNGVAPTDGSDTFCPLELIPRDRSETTTTPRGSDNEFAFFRRQSCQLIRQRAKLLGDRYVDSVSHDREISQCPNCASGSGSAANLRAEAPVYAQQAEPSEAPFADDLMGVDIAIHGLERGDSTLAGAAAGGATSPRVGSHPRERSREHGFCGRAGGFESAEGTALQTTTSSRAQKRQESASVELDLMTWRVARPEQVRPPGTVESVSRQACRCRRRLQAETPPQASGSASVRRMPRGEPDRCRVVVPPSKCGPEGP